MKQLIFMLLISLKSILGQSAQHCMYTQSYQLMNGNNQMNDTTQYIFDFNWYTAQSSISSSYIMTQNQQYMSFTSFIHVVSTTHMNFHFRPYISRFFQAKFYFILFIPCSDQIVVEQITYSGSSNMLMNIPVGGSIGSDLSRYASMVFYKSIKKPTHGNTGSLQIYLLPMIIGNTFQSIQIMTSVSIQLTIGYILLIKHTSEALISDFHSYTAADYEPLLISSVFAPNAQYKCFIGLKLFEQIQAVGNVYYLTISTFTSNQTNGIVYQYIKSSMNDGLFFLLCLAKCSSPNMVPNYTKPFLNCSLLLECTYPNLADPKGGCDSCHPGYFYISSYCIKTIGCLVAIKQYQAIRCITCNFYQNFYINPVDSVCHCRDGFSIVGNICKEICGDGYVYNVQCDDGNLVDGDGCSSKCTAQNGFICSKSYHLMNVTTKCKYYRKDIKLSLQKIEKVRLENKAIMTFQFKPKLAMDRLIDISEGVMFETNRSIKIENRQLTVNVLTLWVTFKEDLENYDANLVVIFKNITFYQQKAEVSFIMQRDGLLVITKDVQLLVLETKIIHYFSVGVMIIYLFSLFFHKTLGLQFLFPFQIMYLSYISNSNPTPFITILNPLGFSCFNFLAYDNDYTNILTNGSTEEFNEDNLEFSIKSMLFSISILIVLKLGKLIIKFNYDNDGNGIKIGPKSKYLFFIIDNFLFSLSISFMLVSFLLLAGNNMHNEYLSIKRMMIPIQLIASLQFFQQWPINSIDKNREVISIQIVSTKPNYVPILLSFYAFVTFTNVIASYSFLSEVQIVLTGIMFAFLVIVVIYRPYEICIHNFGIIFSILLTIFFLIWFKLRKQIAKYRDEQSQLFILILLIAFMFLSSIVTIIRIIKLIQKMYKKWFKMDDKPNEKDKDRFRQSAIDTLKTDIKAMRMQALKAHQVNNQRNIYLMREDIPISEFKQKSRQNRNLNYFLLKKTKYQQNKISKDNIYQ